MAAEAPMVQTRTWPREKVRRSAVVIEDKVSIPGWVDGLESFRRWARSGAMPEQGWFSYLNGEVFVELSMEQFFSHNQVKTEFNQVLGVLVKSEGLGYFVADNMLFSNVDAVLSTEPDALFFTYETLNSGRIRLVAGAGEGYVELEGTPDLVLEIVSRTSVRKDVITLRDLYWRAGIREYWLVDARGKSLQFDILSHTEAGYVVTPSQEGWLQSEVWGREFRFTQETDPLGHPRYTLAVRPSVLPSPEERV